MSYIGKINIPFIEIISDLKRAGLTQQRMAELCICSMPTISALASGKNSDPKYSVGTTLTQLHKSKCK